MMELKLFTSLHDMWMNSMDPNGKRIRDWNANWNELFAYVEGYVIGFEAREPYSHPGEDWGCGKVRRT